MDLGASNGTDQRRPEQGIKSGPDMHMVSSLEERARRIREIKSLPREEIALRIAEDVTLWMRAIFALQEKA